MNTQPDPLEIIDAARRIALEQQSDTLGTQHMLYAIAAVEHDPVGKALRNMLNLGKMGDELAPGIDPRQTPITLSHAMGDVLGQANELALAAQKALPGSIHFLMAILNNQKSDNVAKYVLEANGFTLDRLIDHLAPPQAENS